MNLEKYLGNFYIRDILEIITITDILVILQCKFQILNSRFGRGPKRKSCLYAERHFDGETLNYTKRIYLKKNWRQECC